MAAPAFLSQDLLLAQPSPLRCEEVATGALCLQPHSSASLHFCVLGAWRLLIEEMEIRQVPGFVRRALMAQTTQEFDLTDTGTAAPQTLSLHWVWVC